MRSIRWCIAVDPQRTPPVRPSRIPGRQTAMGVGRRAAPTAAKSPQRSPGKAVRHLPPKSSCESLGSPCLRPVLLRFPPRPATPAMAWVIPPSRPTPRGRSVRACSSTTRRRSRDSMPVGQEFLTIGSSINRAHPSASPAVRLRQRPPARLERLPYAKWPAPTSPALFWQV